jgi:hypothetical protein
MTTPESEVAPSFAERLSHDSRLAIAEEWVNIEILARLRELPHLWKNPVARADWFPRHIIPALEQLECGEVEDVLARIKAITEETHSYHRGDRPTSTETSRSFTAFYNIGWIDLSTYAMPIRCRRAIQVRYAPDSAIGSALKSDPDLQYLLIDAPTIADFAIRQRIDGSIKDGEMLDAQLKRVRPEVRYFLEVYGDEHRLEANASG